MTNNKDSLEYGPEARKILEGLEPARKRPEGFITVDDLPEPDRTKAREFLDDVRRTGQRPRTAKEIEIENAAREFNAPLPTSKGSRPTRSANDPPTSRGPKR